MTAVLKFRVVALNGGDNTFTNKGSITGTVSAKEGNNTFYLMMAAH